LSRCYVRLSGVTLRYPSSPLRTFTIKEWVFNLARLRPNRRLAHDVDALRNVTLRLDEGDRVGVIGPNGAGKTSLLKVIAGIYPLHAGTVETSGAIHSLFDLSLGFEFEATGRENIMYRGLLMGERPAAIRAREQEVVAFADLGEFIDYPVKTYSAGMLVRLAFSISTSFGGDILLLDEVLNAGDAFFMTKARQRINGLVSRSRIMVLVTHDLGAVKLMCNRAIRLEKGHVVDDGPPDAVVEKYLRGVRAAVA
jgi:lipopolysaccharide transport system ATP-binding protein